MLDEIIDVLGPIAALYIFLFYFYPNVVKSLLRNRNERVFGSDEIDETTIEYCVLFYKTFRDYISKKNYDGLKNIVEPRFMVLIKGIPPDTELKQCDVVLVEKISYCKTTGDFKITYSCTIEELNQYLVNVKETFYFNYNLNNQPILVRVETT